MANLCLGTVQFGMNYGINNALGQPSEQDVFQILDLAVKHGIEVFDTAAAYGNAEELLGKYISVRHIEKEKFKVISKLCPKAMEDTSDLEKTLLEEVCGSLERLQIKQLHGYLLHKPEYIYHRDIVAALKKVKQDGLVSNIGISIYKISEGEAALQSGIIDFIQMPYNIFDQRGDHTGFLQKAKSQGITIFTRSAFLQGLFLMDDKKIPNYLEKAKKYLYEFEALCKEYQLDKVSTLLNYPANNQYIDYVVIGVDNAKQLQEHIDNFGAKLPLEFLQKVSQKFANIEEEIILPNLWGVEKQK